jgi:exoribonuclease-2
VAGALASRGFDFGDPPPPTADGEAADAGAPVEDLRALAWSSIDNPESRDLDQVEVAEPLAGGATRLRVGVADVDALAPLGSAADRFARRHATSVYAGARAYGMLPAWLSEGATSLLDGADRLAVVVSLDVDAEGRVQAAGVVRARVRNHARLAYDEVARWLDGRRRRRGSRRRSRASRRWPSSCGCRTRRPGGCGRRGARRARSTSTPRRCARCGAAAPCGSRWWPTTARALIEALMVAANVAVAEWLAARGRPGSCAWCGRPSGGRASPRSPRPRAGASRRRPTGRRSRRSSPPAAPPTRPGTPSCRWPW